MANKHLVPRFFYGTAWKEEQTADCTFQALSNGFTAIDTANQRKHYFEEGVGRGIQKFLDRTGRRREELFLQTKFTYARGQDHRKPYNDQDGFSRQVADSFASSLQHLGTTYLDSYVLHGPYGSHGIADADLETWEAMENLVDAGKVRCLGISNVSDSQLVELLDQSRIKPQFVQNRCFARFGWDHQVREICSDRKIIYQGFSLLTANQMELSSPVVFEIARRHSKSVAQTVFRFCQEVGMICLTGTTDPDHMREDLDIYDFELTTAEIEQLANIGG